MKKYLALFLALVMCLSLSAAACAEGYSSIVGPKSHPKKTSDMPEFLGREDDGYLKITPLSEDEELTEDQQEEFLEAYDVVHEVVPEGMILRYLVYVTAEPYPATALLKITDFTEIAAKLYSAGEWKDLDVAVRDDGVVAITINGPGALAIFTK